MDQFIFKFSSSMIVFNLCWWISTYSMNSGTIMILLTWNQCLVDSRGEDSSFYGLEMKDLDISHIFVHKNWISICLKVSCEKSLKSSSNQHFHCVNFPWPCKFLNHAMGWKICLMCIFDIWTFHHSWCHWIE